MNQLDQLKNYSRIVADTGDASLLEKYSPTDATTNPKLILDAGQNVRYQTLLNKILIDSEKPDNSAFDQSTRFIARFIATIGQQILSIVPGRVSSEIDPRLSFNTLGTITWAKYLISLYEQLGISRERILIKIAATWEGIEAAKQLEKEGIHCNLTLVFSLLQAIACANAQVTLISPFVGRLSEYYKVKELTSKNNTYSAGVQLIHDIYDYFKYHGIKTEIMGASFRTKQQILAIAGVDLITIAPGLMDELLLSDELVECRMYLNENQHIPVRAIQGKNQFLQDLHDDKPAYDLLHDGIAKFTDAFMETEHVALKTI